MAKLKNNFRRVDNLTESGRMSRDSLMKGCGFSSKLLRRPFIGVVNGYGEINPGASHLDSVSKEVKKSILKAGGTPVEFFISSMCVGMCHGGDNYRWTLPWRDITAAYIEATAEINYFDGLVMVTVCDDAVPANLMAAVRLGLPTIVIPGGTMVPGKCKGDTIDKEYLYSKYVQLKEGQLDQETFDKINDLAFPGAGCCNNIMGTGNTMAIFAEALGLTLPGNGTVLGKSKEIFSYAEQAGSQIMSLVHSGLTVKKLLNEKSFENAIRVFLATGGSTNGLLHISAIAEDFGIKIDWGYFDKLSQETPFIVNCKPAGQYYVSDLHASGGVQAVMKELSPILDLDVLTVTGKTLRENLKNVKVDNRQIIAPLSKPFRSENSYAFLKGNLAPDGAIVKQIAVPRKMLSFRGPARVFESDLSATNALIENKISAGDVVVVRYQGPKGDPGMRQSGNQFANILSSKEISDKVAFLTDGRFSGTNKGLLIGHIAPEAYIGGPLALVKDGDVINIDIPNRIINMEVEQEEIAKRKKNWQPPQKDIKRGFLQIYRKLVTQANHGAILSP